MKNLLPRDGILTYLPDFYPTSDAGDLHRLLANETQWKTDIFKIYGKEHPVPRLTSWYGDPGMVYTYSGIVNVPHPWTPTLLSIKARVEKHTGQKFNSLLLNYYRNGVDYMGWHSDDEKSLGPNPSIASLSFGAVRTFQVRHRKDKRLKTRSLDLESGSLVLMQGEMQNHWHHRVAPSKKIEESRINLTFRTLV